MTDRGHDKEKVIHNNIFANGAINITSAEGITVEYKSTGDFQADIAQLSRDPSLAWMADLQSNPDVNWVEVKETYKEWHEESTSLSGPAMAVIAIAITVATWGAGAAIAGAGTAAAGAGAGAAAGGAAAGASTAAAGAGFGTAFAAGAANAAFSSLIVNSVTSFINAGGDLGEMFKMLGSSDMVKSYIISIASAGITAGAADGLGYAGLTGSEMNLTQHAQQIAVTSLTSATLEAGINGGDFGETLIDGVKTGAIFAVASGVSSEIGKAYKSGNIDKATQLIAHAALGCAAGAASSGDCAAGAAGGVIGEVAGDIYKNSIADDLGEDIKNGTLTVGKLNYYRQNGVNIAKLSGAIAAALAGAESDAIYDAAALGQNAAENNAIQFLSAAEVVLLASGATVTLASVILASDGEIDSGELGRIFIEEVEKGARNSYTLGWLFNDGDGDKNLPVPSGGGSQNGGDNKPPRDPNRDLERMKIALDVYEFVDDIFKNENIPDFGSLSDVDARFWYLDQEKKIPSLIDQTASLEDQAKQAHAIRNYIREVARDSMSNRHSADHLAINEPHSSFEHIYDKTYNKGFVGNDIYREIINSSQRSRGSINRELGINE